MRKLVGHVTEAERNEIRMLFERKNGLVELAKIITSDNSELYEKLVADLGETSTQFQNWWNVMGAKYNWNSLPEGKWEIDFNDCAIYLINPEK